MKIEEMSIETMLEIAKVQFFIKSISEAAVRDIPHLPKAQAEGAIALAAHTIEKLVAEVEERRGDVDKAKFLVDLTSIFDESSSGKPKVKAKVKAKAKAKPKTKKKGVAHG